MTESLLVEYLRTDGSPLRLTDLGVAELERLGVPLTKADRALRIEAEARTSKAGNTYFEYQQSAVPLPDGLDTKLRAAGVDVVFEQVKPSKAGNPTRTGETEVEIGGMPYLIKAYMAKTRNQYWVKVVAHKRPKNRPTQTDAPIAGGRIV